VRKALKAVAKDKHHRLILSMWSFYSTVATYLVSRLPLDNGLLKHLTISKPTLSVLPASVVANQYIARKLPSVADNADDDIISVLDEWKLYLADDVIKSMDKEKVNVQRIDYYWRVVLSRKGPDNKDKFSTFKKLIHKTCK
jgi:hypothetical protein